MSIILDARTATDHFPGIGRYVVNLAHTLARLVPECPLTLLHDPSVTSTRLVLPSLPLLACPASPFSVRQQWVIPHLLRQSGATLYHSAYYLMPYRPGLPTVLTCYDIIPLIYPEYFTPAQRLIYRISYWLATQTAQAILSISEATKTDLIRHFRIAPNKIVVTPLAADPHFQPQPPAAIAAVRARYALPERYVLYFGSNKPHKNIVRLVRAFGQSASLKAQASTALIIAGHWDSRYPEAKQLVEKEGWQERIKFAGPVAEADLPALYSGAQLFVFPSEYEGFGLPVLEAMACGVPVASSRTSSLPEVAGDAAVFFDPHDVIGLQAALEHCLSNTEARSAVCAKSLERAAQFSWARTAQLTWNVYEQVLNSGSSPHSGSWS